MLFRRLLPFCGLVRRVLRRPRAIDKAATGIKIIQPEEIEEAPPLYFLDGQLEKATAGVPGFSTLQGELELTRQRKFHHAPVIEYTLKDCLVHDGGVNSSVMSISKKRLESLHFLRDSVETLETAVYCMSSSAHQFFGHWLQDACATTLLASPGEGAILDTRADWPHTASYVDAFGFSPPRGRLQFVRSLRVFQDHGQGSSKRQRYQELRKRLTARVGEGLPARAVYFRRGRTGQSRVIANSDEIENALAAKGFDIFDLGTASIEEIYRRFRNATVVVSVEGSHMNHLYYSMRPQAGIVAIIPGDRFGLSQPGYAAAAGLRFGFIVVQPSDEGYVVDIRDLLATIDLVGQAAG